MNRRKKNVDKSNEFAAFIQQTADYLPPAKSNDKNINDKEQSEESTTDLNPAINQQEITDSTTDLNPAINQQEITDSTTDLNPAINQQEITDSLTDLNPAINQQEITDFSADTYPALKQQNNTEKKQLKNTELFTESKKDKFKQKDKQKNKRKKKRPSRTIAELFEDPVPKEPIVNTTLQLPKSVNERLKKLANKLGKSKNEVILTLIEALLEEKEMN